MDWKALRPRYLSTEQAARFMGVSKAVFLTLTKEFTSDWMRPVYLGAGRKKYKMWVHADVLCLSHIYDRRQTTPPEIPSGKTKRENS